MLLCRNGFLTSTRRLLTGSLTVALAYPLISVAQVGHVRGVSQASIPGPWQLYSTATGLDLGIYADFPTCRQAAVTGPDMSCKPATAVNVGGPTPPIVQPPVVPTPTMNGAFQHRREQPAQRAASAIPSTASNTPASLVVPPTSARSAPSAASRTWRSTIRSSTPAARAPRTCTRSSATPGPTLRAPSSRSATPATRRAAAARSIARPTGCRR